MGKFKVGDIVEAFGMEGTVISTFRCVKVLFEDDKEHTFYLDGRWRVRDPGPSLKLIEQIQVGKHVETEGKSKE